jgi:hypothetical protein
MRPLQRSPDVGCLLGYLVSETYKAPGQVPCLSEAHTYARAGPYATPRQPPTFIR